MLTLGEYQTLTILRDTEPGLFLGDEEENEVLLPNRYKPETFEIGDKITVFVYLDNEERPVATTDKPYVTKGDFALLRCNQVTKYGAFLDWGLVRSEEHTSELQSRENLVCRLLLEKKKKFMYIA